MAEKHATVYAALHDRYPNQPDERLQVVAPNALEAATTLDRLLGANMVSAKYVHGAGRDSHDWFEVRLVTGDTWVMAPYIASAIYWAQEKEDTFRYRYTGKDRAAFVAADTSAREAMSERGEYHPYADDASDMEWDLFG